MTRLALLVLVGCAANMRQDAHTGRDGALSGATELRVEDRVVARGIVTYPGGDRVDWYAIRVARPGDVTVDLQWHAPRLGLRLGIDVFDAYRERLSCGMSTLDTYCDAGLVRDVIYVRVYARGRGDAGRYRLIVKRTDPYVEHIAIDVPDPPNLPKVPEPTMCDPYSFDPHRICEPPRGCPTDAPPGWPGCKQRCPNPPDVNIRACWDTMPCPTPPDPRIRACKATP